MTVICLIASADGMVAAFEQAAPRGNHHLVFLHALETSSLVQFAVPILSVLPATTAFLDDISSGYIKAYLPRTGKPAYIKAKIMSAILSGGGTLILGALFSWIVTTCLLFPTELVSEANEVSLYSGYKLLTVFILLFLNGAFWSILGTLLASVTNSRYMAYASPFVTYYLLIILHERYFPNLVIIDPKKWLVMEVELYVRLVLIGVTIFLSILFYIFAERRISNV